MTTNKEAELKKIYTRRLREAGYNTVPELVQILPPTIMNIIGSSIITAEKLFISALKTHMRNVQIYFQGEPPEGINKALTDLGYMTIQEIADSNPELNDYWVNGIRKIAVKLTNDAAYIHSFFSLITLLRVQQGENLEKLLKSN